MRKITRTASALLSAVILLTACQSGATISENDPETEEPSRPVSTRERDNESSAPEQPGIIPDSPASGGLMDIINDIRSGNDLEDYEPEIASEPEEPLVRDPATAGTGITVSSREGRELNICSYNEEFKDFLEKYYVVPDGITVNWYIYPAEGGTYQEFLDKKLLDQSLEDADERIDLFVGEPHYLSKYVDSDFTLDLSTIGVYPLSTGYEYMTRLGTSKNGEYKGVGYYGCPGGIVYRRSLAEEVFGTSDPAEVQDMLDTWDKYNAAAQMAKENGIVMTASYEYTLRAYLAGSSSPWVDEDDRLNMEGFADQWINDTLNAVSNGEANPVRLWTEELGAEMQQDSRSLCFFGPKWYYDYVIPMYDESTYGDWAFIEGPQAYYWGGSYLLAASDTDNPETIADIMNAFTANEDILWSMVENDEAFVNNISVNQRQAENADYYAGFLGGQNDYAVLNEIAQHISVENETAYDSNLTTLLLNAFQDYLDGVYYTSEELRQGFYYNVVPLYPNIVVPY